MLGKMNSISKLLIHSFPCFQHCFDSTHSLSLLEMQILRKNPLTAAQREAQKQRCLTFTCSLRPCIYFSTKMLLSISFFGQDSSKKRRARQKKKDRTVYLYFTFLLILLHIIFYNGRLLPVIKKQASKEGISFFLSLSFSLGNLNHVSPLIRTE